MPVRLVLLLLLAAARDEVEHPDGEHGDAGHDKDADEALEHDHEGLGQRIGIKREVHIQLSFLSDQALDERNDEAAGDHRSDLAADVRARRMHEQVVVGILLAAHLVDDARGHRERGDTGRADHGVDLLPGEEVEELGKEHAADGIEHEADEAEGEDGHRLEGDERLRLHAERHGDAQQERDEVGQLVLRAVAEGTEHAALADEVAEHEEADQLRGLGRDGAGHDGDDDREEDARALAHACGRVGHADAAFLLRRDEADDGRLHDGHERHVRIRGDHDRALVVRAEVLRHEDGGRAVGRGDGGDGGRVVELKADEPGDHEREEHAELRRRAKEHHLRVGEQGAKVDHRADADEQQQREQLRRDAGVVERLDGLAVHKRQVDEDRAKAHGEQERRLHLARDGEIDQHAADGDHHALLPGEVGHVGEQIQKVLQCNSSHLTFRCGANAARVCRPAGAYLLRGAAENEGLAACAAGEWIRPAAWTAIRQPPTNIIRYHFAGIPSRPAGAKTKIFTRKRFQFGPDAGRKRPAGPPLRRGDELEGPSGGAAAHRRAGEGPFAGNRTKRTEAARPR